MKSCSQCSRENDNPATHCLECGTQFNITPPPLPHGGPHTQQIHSPFQESQPMQGGRVWANSSARFSRSETFAEAFGLIGFLCGFVIYVLFFSQPATGIWTDLGKPTLFGGTGFAVFWVASWLISGSFVLMQPLLKRHKSAILLLLFLSTVLIGGALVYYRG